MRALAIILSMVFLLIFVPKAHSSNLPVNTFIAHLWGKTIAAKTCSFTKGRQSYVCLKSVDGNQLRFVMVRPGPCRYVMLRQDGKSTVKSSAKVC